MSYTYIFMLFFCSCACVFITYYFLHSFKKLDIVSTFSLPHSICVCLSLSPKAYLSCSFCQPNSQLSFVHSSQHTTYDNMKGKKRNNKATHTLSIYAVNISSKQFRPLYCKFLWLACLLKLSLVQKFITMRLNFCRITSFLV